MKKVSRIVSLAVLAAVGVWLWMVIFPSPEKIVRNRLAAVASRASFPHGENPIVIAARSESLAGYFNTNVEVNINWPEHVGREFAGHENNSISRAEITQASAGLRRKLDNLKVEFPDMSVTVAPDKLSAVAEVVVKIQVVGERDVLLQEIKFTFRKIETDWLITRVETVRALS
jgi:hypothetical protein